MSWQKENDALFQEERSYIRSTFPDIEITQQQGKVMLHGDFPVCDNSGSFIRSYFLVIIFPSDYPNWVPTVLMREPGVTYIADRHMFTDGKACLCLPHEVFQFVEGEIRFRTFFENLLKPWLIGQAAFDRNGIWPFDARDHDEKGILQGFADILGIDDMEIVKEFTKLLIRKNAAKGHERCPCGSRRRLRDCHFSLYHNCRSSLPKEALKIYRNKLRNRIL